MQILRVRSFWVIRIQISDPRSLGSWCIKGTDKSTLITDSSVPLMHHDPSDLGSLIRIRIRITPKERTLSHFNLVSLRKLHRHATYQEIIVYHSIGPQLANHKYTGKHRTLSLCFICPQNFGCWYKNFDFSNRLELKIMKSIKCKIFSRQLQTARCDNVN